MAYLSFLITFWTLAYIQDCVGETCLAYYSTSGTTSYYMHCSYKCCGTSYSRYCCTDNTAATIAGAVIGCLLVAAIIVVIVVVVYIQQKKAKLRRAALSGPHESHIEVQYIHPDVPPPQYTMDPVYKTSPDTHDYPTTAANYQLQRETTQADLPA